MTPTKVRGNRTDKYSDYEGTELVIRRSYDTQIRIVYHFNTKLGRFQRNTKALTVI